MKNREKSMKTGIERECVNEERVAIEKRKKKQNEDREEKEKKKEMAHLLCNILCNAMNEFYPNLY